MKNLLAIILIIATVSLYGQTDTEQKSDAVQLYELAAADGKITKKELKLIKQLTQDDSKSLKIRRRPNYDKNLDPSVYVKRGLEHGYKLTLWKIQSKIIDDINEITNEIIYKK